MTTYTINALTRIGMTVKEAYDMVADYEVKANHFTNPNHHKEIREFAKRFNAPLAIKTPNGWATLNRIDTEWYGYPVYKRPCMEER